MLIKFIAKLIEILRSAASPNQIAFGFVLGMAIGLTPLWSLHNLVIFILIVILNVNITMAIFSFGIFSGLAYLIDPLLHNIGFFILVDLSSLHGLWTAMYNFPILALSKYNNTVVMGSLICSILLIFPMFFLTKKAVVVYRENIDTKMEKWKIVQAVKGSKIYSIYEKIKNIGE
jgi:uncharacterized protein (TIGR03546 family)